jgi:hypothetical protein
MAAWNHTSYWDQAKYQLYRGYVSEQAPLWRGHRGLDCADLSTVFVIHFAFLYGLPVTFWGMDRVRYISKGERQTPAATFFNKTWLSRDEYISAVLDRLNTQAVWTRNTIGNPRGPQPGDLMIGYGSGLHHTALVYRVYAPGAPHPRAGDPTVPDFPGDEEAIAQAHQTEYFRSRQPDANVHVDYLNYRSRRKDRAELIYFASVADMRSQGLEFRQWKPGVIDNWTDWNGRGDPPR